MVRVGGVQKDREREVKKERKRERERDGDGEGEHLSITPAHMCVSLHYFCSICSCSLTCVQYRGAECFSTGTDVCVCVCVCVCVRFVKAAGVVGHHYLFNLFMFVCLFVCLFIYLFLSLFRLIFSAH